MKKTFKIFACALLSVFALSSCEDVPAPYNLPGKTENGPAGGSTVTGISVTCAEALALVNELADGATSTETYTITGYITEVVGDVSRNQQTFWMADTPGGGRVFEAYWANLPEGVEAFTAGTKVSITGKIMKFVNANTGAVVPEIKNATVQILDGEQGGGDPVTGTVVTCAQAIELVNALSDGATSAETYSITGYITDVFGTVSRNQQSFWIADTKDGGKMIQAYWANLPEGVTGFTVGMKVTITGPLLKYVKDGAVTPEIKNANVVILEQGEGGGSGEGGSGTGTAITCVQAVELVNALADGATSTETYTISGYITEIVGSPSASKTTGQMQQTFWMADTKDGGKVFEAYWANLPEGVSAFVAGSKVTITGQLMKYVSKDGVVTPEIKNADVVILEQGEGGSTGGGETGGGNTGTGGTTVTSLQNGGFETWTSDSEPQGWKSASTASNATLSKSTDARTGSFACCIGAPGTANKRLASQEMTLAAGTYKLSYYAKSTTADPCQTRGGYVPVTDGAVGNYYYSSTYTNLNNSTWTLVEYEFTLSAETTVCVLVMNPKNSSYSTSQNILVDDVTLVKQ